MKCQDVRRALPLFVDGQLALTEWAILQGHLLECAECRKEVDRLRAVAGVRARATHLRATVMTGAAMAAILAVAVAGGYLVYHGGFPDVPSWSTPAPPRAAVPAAPVPEPVTPVPPIPAPRPSPPPPPARAKGNAEATPWGTAPPAPAARPAATAAAPAEDRMPSQAHPVPAPSAPPGAEAMPTQGPARRP
jgi:hypothetical protein